MDIYRRHFGKILLLSNMALDIAAFGESQGIHNLVERLDLTCGALPSEEYSQVIDQSAPEIFLDLYSKMVENRFAFAVTELMKLNSAYITPLCNYCFERGKSLQPEKVTTVESAYELINTYILDGMPSVDVKKLSVIETNKIQWEKITETHKEYWEKAGGDINVYYQLQTCFIQGLLENSGFEYNNSENRNFSICRSQNA